jgi:RsmE family RNA methyltransferase
MNIILYTQAEVSDGRVVLDKRDARALHLLKTLHKATGDSFEAGVIGGRLGTGTIRTVGTRVELELALDDEPPAKLPVTLGVGFVRQIQLRRILREAANFGVAAIDIFGTDTGDPNYRKTALFDDGGAEAALLEGLTEARDTRFPLVHRFGSVREWIADLDSRENAANTSRLVFDNIDGGGEGGMLQKRPPFVLAVGSERGFSDDERALFNAAGFAQVSLGTRALRTETACVAAVTWVRE